MQVEEDLPQDTAVPRTVVGCQSDEIEEKSHVLGQGLTQQRYGRLPTERPVPGGAGESLDRLRRN